MRRAAAAAEEVVGLASLIGRVEEWRRHREGGRSRVPEELWNAAVEVARVRGVWATSKALRFNYVNLRERVERAGGSPAKATGSPFVEVQLPTLMGDRQEGKTVIEWTGRAGERMRIDITGQSRLDVVGLAQAFWGRAP